MTHPNPMRHHFLFKLLAERFGCDVFVLGFSGLGNSPHVINRDLVSGENIKVIGEHAICARNPALYYLLNVQSIWRSIEHALTSLRIDVIVHSNLIPSVAVVMLAQRYSARVPVVYDYIEYYPQSSSAYFDSSVMKALAYHATNKVMMYLIQRSDVVITVCDSHAKLVREIAPKKLVHVVPNGVDLEMFRADDENEDSKHFDPKKLDLIYVGSVDDWIDLETVFDAMSGLREEGFHTRLTVVGGSHGQHYLSRLKFRIASLGLGEDVLFTGYVPHHLVPQYINQADVGLAPYKRVLKNDGTPLKISEYLACGKIILSTRIPEISRRFGHLLYFYDGAGDMMCLLKQIATNRTSIIKRVEGARDFLSGYSWDVLADKYYQILRSVAG